MATIYKKCIICKIKHTMPFKLRGCLRSGMTVSSTLDFIFPVFFSKVMWKQPLQPFAKIFSDFFVEFFLHYGYTMIFLRRLHLLSRNCDIILYFWRFFYRRPFWLCPLLDLPRLREIYLPPTRNFGTDLKPIFLNIFFLILNYVF